jgi:hypothetical protein
LRGVMDDRHRAGAVVGREAAICSQERACRLGPWWLPLTLVYEQLPPDPTPRQDFSMKTAALPPNQSRNTRSCRDPVRTRPHCMTGGRFVVRA